MKTNRVILTLLTLLISFPIYAGGNAENGKLLYKIYCTQCHGINGDGNGINIRDMSVQPRDHTDQEEMSTRTDADLIKVIKHGGKSINKSVLMPSWERNLNDQQIDDLVAYLRELCCKE